MQMTLSWHGEWKAVFEVDVDRAAPACLESLNFFGDPITRDDESNISTVKAFLQFWGATLINISQRKTMSGVLREISETEGIFPLDGRQGVTLVSCDSWTFEPDFFEVES